MMMYCTVVFVRYFYICTAGTSINFQKQYYPTPPLSKSNFEFFEVEIINNYIIRHQMIPSIYYCIDRYNYYTTDCNKKGLNLYF